jgi:hypothetical protein
MGWGLLHRDRGYMIWEHGYPRASTQDCTGPPLTLTPWYHTFTHRAPGYLPPSVQGCEEVASRDPSEEKVKECHEEGVIERNGGLETSFWGEQAGPRALRKVPAGVAEATTRNVTRLPWPKDQDAKEGDRLRVLVKEGQCQARGGTPRPRLIKPGRTGRRVGVQLGNSRERGEGDRTR